MRNRRFIPQQEFEETKRDGVPLGRKAGSGDEQRMVCRCILRKATGKDRRDEDDCETERK